MATATPKARGAVASSMQFRIVEDNAGDYHWTLLGGDGTSLARSGNFASYERTEDAARIVLAGAAPALRGSTPEQPMTARATCTS